MRRNSMFFAELKQILSEGGAAGHLAHPFDVEGVETGNDLITVFKKAAHSLATNPASLKFDGVNIAMRVVKDPEGRYQFVFDRGSSKELDVAGITIDKLNDRFPSGANGAEHGMVKIGRKVIGVLNANINGLLPELKRLGVVNDTGAMPVRLINAEYVKGLTNTVDYSKLKNPEFIALHNILVSNWKDERKKARNTSEVAFDSKALATLAKKMDEAFKKQYEGAFRVYGPQHTQTGKDKEAQLDAAIDAELQKNFTIKYSAGKSETKTLGQWLARARNPREHMMKAPYINLLKGEALDTVISDTNDKNEVRNAVDSTVFYHATRVIGKAMLAAIDLQNKDEFGQMVDAKAFQGHEGLVINDPAVSRGPFKLTGDFLVANVDMSKFKKEKDRGASGSAWVFFVGSFKPPTRAHFEAIQKNVGRVKGDGRFVVIIGQPKKEENVRSKTIDAVAAKRVFELYCKKYGLGSVEIRTVDELARDQGIADALAASNARPDIRRKTSMAQMASPVMALNFYLQAYTKPTDTVYAIKGQKDIDDQRFSFLERDRPGFTVIVQPNVLMRNVRGTVPVSATDLRNAIDAGDEATIKELIPEKVSVEEFMRALGTPMPKKEAFASLYSKLIVEAAYKMSAGVLLHTPDGRRVFLVRNGGPFFQGKESGSWSIPKGLVEKDEDPEAAAKREFTEETGMELPKGRLTDLGEIRMKSGKIVRAYGLAARGDEKFVRSNTFEL